MFSSKRHAWLLLGVFLTLYAAAGSVYGADITVNTATTYQTMEGFGGGLMFRVYPYGRVYQDELYDSIFTSAKCNVIRVINYYDSALADNGNALEIAMMKDIQEKYPEVKIFMASWTPPKYIKQGDTIAGVVNGNKMSLKKVNNQFMYTEYANYWYNSIKDCQDNGVNLSWVSIQNEPDWPAEWEGCCLLPSESGNTASYPKALDAVYNRAGSLGVPFIGPDMTGPAGISNVSIDQYMSAINKSQIVAICHHFYNGADVSHMRSIKQNYPTLPRFQTEFLYNEGENGKTWFDHIQLIQNTLIEEEASMYLLFALAYKTASTHCFFSQDTTNGTYVVRPIYFGFKHFSKSIRSGWKRVAVSGGGGSLNVSAFANTANDSMAVVIVNTGGATTVSLGGIPAAIDTGEAFQTTKGSGSEQTKKYERIAQFGETVPTINIDGSSVTTVDLWKKITVKAAGNRASAVSAGGKLFVVASRRDRAIDVSFDACEKGAAYTVSLCDMSGKRMAAPQEVRPSHGAIKSFAGPFAGGTYMVRVEGNGVVRTQKVIVP